MRSIFTMLSLVGGLLASPVLQAVSGVNPSGVNVRQNGPSTVFLTFQNLASNEVAAEAFWCSEVTTTGVSSSNPCVPGTLLGRLPPRLDRSRISGTASRNLTDIMTIPASVTRRALRAATREGDGSFFYVRRFTDGVNDTFVTVTCRLAGGGARTPLALTQVQIWFEGAGESVPVYRLKRGQTPPPVSVYLRYNGTGRLKGRWEIVRPGEMPPQAEDLLTEATLPVEQRSRQKRYSLIQRFSHFLPPVGSQRLPGPDPRLLPTAADGPYLLLFRVEASADKEGDSKTLDGVVNSGGVAGFPMPVLRYHVAPDAPDGRNLRLLTPPEGAMPSDGEGLIFSWIEPPGITWARLEVRSESGLELEATLPAGEMRYDAPPWLAQNASPGLRWRVLGLDRTGQALIRSAWRALGRDASFTE